MPAFPRRMPRFESTQLLVLVTLLGACHPHTTPPAAIASINIAAPSDYLVAGSTLQLTATAKDAGGHVLTGRNLSWTSSDLSVLTVDAGGLISGVAQGNATVSVSAEGQSNSINLMVTMLALIRVTAQTFVIQPGTGTQLTAVVLDSTDHEISTPVTWSSAGAAILTVSASGRAMALAEGVASVSATAGSVTGTIPIAVQQAVTGKIAFVSRRGPVQQTPVPTWSPDSMRIAFQTNRDGNNEIYAMYADGSNQVNLTNNPADDTSPSWGP